MGDRLGQDRICFQPVHSSPFTLFSLAKWAPLMEEIFSSQAAVLALTGAGAYLKGIFLPPLPPTSHLLKESRARQTDSPTEAHPH